MWLTKGKYCYNCGKELKQVGTGWYDTNTGEEKTRGLCEDECHTYGHDHPFWFVFLPIKTKCRRCGKPTHW